MTHDPLSSHFVVDLIRLPHFANDLPLPYYATTGSAGLDICAANTEDIVIPSMRRVLIPSGLSVALPIGYEAQIRPRSGLAVKHGVTILNAPGTIDSDYRGEIMILLINLGTEDFIITRGMRIAQMIVTRYENVKWNLVSNLDETDRNYKGFGSTGI